jgi:poly(A) polymerase
MAILWSAVPNDSPLTEPQQRALAELLRLAPVASELGERFHTAGHRLALVGGSVRDALLGRLGQDLDFTTDARPDQIMAVVKPWSRRRVWDGDRFRYSRRPKDGYRLEITTTVRSVRPDHVSRLSSTRHSLTGDLKRRDFTVNAMAIEMLPRFVDPYHGLRDLSRKILRTPRLPRRSPFPTTRCG